MAKKRQRKRQKAQSQQGTIAAGMIHLAIIFAVAMFAVKRCRWFSEVSGPFSYPTVFQGNVKEGRDDSAN
jgi:hypothetical protein